MQFVGCTTALNFIPTVDFAGNCLLDLDEDLPQVTSPSYCHALMNTKEVLRGRHAYQGACCDPALLI